MPGVVQQFATRRGRALRARCATRAGGTRRSAAATRRSSSSARPTSPARSRSRATAALVHPGDRARVRFTLDPAGRHRAGHALRAARGRPHHRRRARHGGRLTCRWMRRPGRNGRASFIFCVKTGLLCWSNRMPSSYDPGRSPLAECPLLPSSRSSLPSTSRSSSPEASLFHALVHHGPSATVAGRRHQPHKRQTREMIRSKLPLVLFNAILLNVIVGAGIALSSGPLRRRLLALTATRPRRGDDLDAAALPLLPLRALLFSPRHALARGCFAGSTICTTASRRPCSSTRCTSIRSKRRTAAWS